jgi:hypothetical protein
MADIIKFTGWTRPRFLYSLPERYKGRSAEVIVLHPAPRLTMLAENLWCYRMEDTPEACEQAQRIIAEFRANNYVIPAYMKEY